MVLSRLWVLEMALCRLVCLEKKKLLNHISFSFEFVCSLICIFCSSNFCIKRNAIVIHLTISNFFKNTLGVHSSVLPLDSSEYDVVEY